MDGRTRQISKEIQDLNNTVNQLDLTPVYRTLIPTREDIFFSSVCGTLSTKCQATEQVSMQLKRLKLYKVCPLTTME